MQHFFLSLGMSNMWTRLVSLQRHLFTWQASYQKISPEIWAMSVKFLEMIILSETANSFDAIVEVHVNFSEFLFECAGLMCQFIILNDL